MATYQVQHSIPYFSNIPEDVVTNVLHFQKLTGSEIASPGDLENLSEIVRDFFDNCYGGLDTPNTIASYANPAAARQKMYNIGDPIPRAPVFDQVVPMIEFVRDPGNTSMPPEVAVCLSYHTEYVSGVPKPSQRGRIYIGAIGNGFILNGGLSSFPAVGQLARENLCQAADLMAAAALAADWGWVVHSTKLDEDFAVAGGWVDNAWDTQRRRGADATLRSTFAS